MKFYSLGGWCGTTIGLRNKNLYGEALPFDYIRSSFEGIINAIDNDFDNFFPNKLEPEITKNGKEIWFRGKYFSFCHHDLRNTKVVDTFNRRIKRFYSFLNTNKDKVVFVRTVVSYDYNEELNLVDDFENLINEKFKSLNYILIMIIPLQPKTSFYKTLNKKTFVFTLHGENTQDNIKLSNIYSPIYNYIKNKDLFNNTPEYVNLKIKNFNTRFVYDHGVIVFNPNN